MDTRTVIIICTVTCYLNIVEDSFTAINMDTTAAIVAVTTYNTAIWEIERTMYKNYFIVKPFISACSGLHYYLTPQLLTCQAFI